MDESQRQSCLETMGIQSYFPRYILPDAKESVQCEWTDENALSQALEVEASVPLEALQEKPSVPRKARPSLVVNRVVKDESVEAKPVSDKLDSVESNSFEVSESKPEIIKKEAKPELVRFQLAFIRVNESICILNQIPTIGSNRLTHAHQSLLLNILSSLKQNTEHTQFDDMPFRWPMIEGNHVDNSQAAARKALHSFLEQKQSDGQFRLLWVMGEMAAEFIDHEQKNWQIIGTRSLDEILNFPQLKRDVWRQLRALPSANLN